MLTQLGSYPPVLNGGKTNLCVGACWVVCLATNIADVVDCNGGVGWNSSNANIPIINRIVVKAKNSIAIPSYGGGTSDVFSWHEDLLMSSFYQSGWGSSTKVTDGSKWCSDYLIPLANGGTINSATATNGLNGKTKCTWLFQTATGDEGPTIKLTSASFVKFLFYWAEWINVAGIGANGVISGDIKANYHIGNYLSSEGVFLNPAKTVTDAGNGWILSSLSWAIAEIDPSIRIPGSIGDAIYFSRANGPFKATQTIKIDSPNLLAIYDHFDSQYKVYDGLVSSYNIKKDDYNKALTDEKTRQNDFI